MDNKYEMVFGEPPIIVGAAGESAFIGTPQQIMIINEDQKTLLETLCDVEIDRGTRRHYKLNNLRFTIRPKFGNQ